MFCSACGVALTQRLKYCNRCGANLNTNEGTDIALIEKRMDSEMEGLFWITVFGLGLILGGMVLMKKVQLNDWLIVAYLAISSAAFITYFGISVWQMRRLAGTLREAKGVMGDPVGGELGPAKVLASLESAPSVTDHTTRTLEPVPGNEFRDQVKEMMR